MPSYTYLLTDTFLHRIAYKHILAHTHSPHPYIYIYKSNWTCILTHAYFSIPTCMNYLYTQPYIKLCTHTTVRLLSVTHTYVHMLTYTPTFTYLVRSYMATCTCLFTYILTDLLTHLLRISTYTPITHILKNT